MLKLKESQTKIQPEVGQADAKFEPAKPYKGHVKFEELNVSTQSSLKKSVKTTDATVHPVDEPLVENENDDKRALTDKCDRDKLIARILNGKPKAPILKGMNPDGKTTRSETTDREAKKHKIKFKEQIQEVNIVENWKEYNIDTQGDGITCQCNLF